MQFYEARENIDIQRNLAVESDPSRRKVNNTLYKTKIHSKSMSTFLLFRGHEFVFAYLVAFHIRTLEPC